MNLPRFLLPAVALCAAASAHAEITWLTDLDQAKAVAAKEKKAILVDFTGSDWCGWCIRLKKEVFDQKDFEVASKDFVFVEVDFPRGKKLAPEHKAKNDALAKKFKVRTFPTILLMNAQGQPFAEIGYEEGGPANYLKSLAKLLKDNTPAGAKKFADRAEAEAKEAELNDALEVAVGPFIEKKDVPGAEAALAKFIKQQGVTGESATRIAFRARMGISLAIDPDDHDAILKLIDKTLANEAKGDFVAELKELRERVVKVRDEFAGKKK